MNINEAARQLERAVAAYGARTPEGAYCVPLEAQRPVYLIGPPGVGKTAVVAQVAAKLGIGYAAYTILEYGGNDCDFYWKRIASDPSGDHHPKTTLEEFRREFVKLIGKIRALGSQPIILSLPPIESKEYFDFFSRKMNDEQRDNILGWMGGEVEAISRWHDSYNQVLFGVAGETSTPILDITAPFSNHSEGWRTLLCHDGIHPNSEGHRLIASSIMTSTRFDKAV